VKRSRGALKISSAGLAAVVVVLAAILGPAPGFAETTPPADPSPTPTVPASSTPASLVESADASTSTSPSSSAEQTDPATGDQYSASAVEATGETPRSLTLTVTLGGLPGGTFYSDIGSFKVSGTEVGGTDPVEIWRSRAGTWTRLGTLTPDDAGRYAASYLVKAAGTYGFQATLGGAPTSAAVISNLVSVTVKQSSIVLNKPVTSIDSLKSPRISGVVIPARTGVDVHIDVLRSGSWRQVASDTTDSYGRFSLWLSYGKGSLATYTIRATYRVPNRDRWIRSSSQGFTRIAVLNPVTTRTTSTEVAETYHAGCPVGPSKLSTIRMNFYGRDRKMHRGVIIVRTDLTTEIKRGFRTALVHRYSIARMRNPNVYGGSDPVQMEANNTSGFNCRKVVGNPYAQSPHSYGIAIDVNPVQNPYRDINGKWWPENGLSYIDRSDRRRGMLYSDSSLTRSLRGYEFFWGGFWYPGRDYQHFQYNP
jgi:D-alanyl-D-alanine carboxypeptidase